MKPDKEIPAGLWATIVIEIIIDVVAIVVCYKKGFLSYDYGTPEILHGAHAKCISRKALGFFRFVFMVYSFAIVMHAVQQGTWSYRYFTVWNYTTLFLLFLFLFAHSVTDKLPIWFSNFTFSMYHIEFTMIFVVDIIYWTMLFDGDATFLDVNVHLVNAVLLILETSLNRFYMVPAQVVFALLFALAFVISSWALYVDNGVTMPYGFMDPDVPAAYGWYLGISIGMIAVYFMALGLTWLKEKCYKSGDKNDYEVV